MLIRRTEIATALAAVLVGAVGVTWALATLASHTTTDLPPAMPVHPQDTFSCLALDPGGWAIEISGQIGHGDAQCIGAQA